MKGDTEMGDANNGYNVSGGSVPVSHVGNESSARRAKLAGVLLRLTAMALCATSLALMVTNKQTHNFVIPVNPPVILTKKAKFSNVLALEVFVYANAIVAGYSFFRAVWAILSKNSITSNRFYEWMGFLLDQVMVYGLIGVAAAATEVAYLAKNGEPDVEWAKICNVFSQFCNQVGVSVVICFAGILALICLAIVSAKKVFSTDFTPRAIATRKDVY